MFEQLVDRLKRRTQQDEGEIQFGTFEEATEPSAMEESPEAPALPQTPAEAPAIQTRQSENIELKVVRPEMFADVSTIADHLLRGCTVVLNLEVMDKASILRMLDFLNGVTYATDGEIKKVAPSTYIVTAHGVDVTDAE